jgi:actin-related protein
MDKSILGLADMVVSTIGKCDANIKSDLFNHIIITGGNSLIRVIF